MTLPWMMLTQIMSMEVQMMEVLMMEVLMMVNEVEAVRKTCLEVELFRSGCMSKYYWMASFSNVCQNMRANTHTHRERQRA